MKWVDPHLPFFFPFLSLPSRRTAWECYRIGLLSFFPFPFLPPRVRHMCNSIKNTRLTPRFSTAPFFSSLSSFPPPPLWTGRATKLSEKKKVGSFPLSLLSSPSSFPRRVDGKKQECDSASPSAVVRLFFSSFLLPFSFRIWGRTLDERREGFLLTAAPPFLLSLFFSFLFPSDGQINGIKGLER